MTYVLLISFLLCAVLLILLILIQKGRGAGLAGAFGGGGGQSAFGTKTADVLTKATAALTAIFFLLALVTGWYLNPNRSRGGSGGGATTSEQESEPGAKTPQGDQPDAGGATEGDGATAPATGGGEAAAPAATGGATETPKPEGGTE